MASTPDTTRSLANLLDQHARIPDAARARDWLHETLALWGTVARPSPTATGRPGSHLWEIDALDVHATGADLDEALINWRRAARNLTLGDAA